MSNRVRIKYITTVVFLFCFSLLLFAQNRAFVLVIDPGHGGKDPGALGRRSKEKNIALAVAKKFGAKVAHNYPDVKVIYTRKTDKFIELKERANIANRVKANLFISIHCNALDRRKRSPEGVETYILGLHRSKDNLEVAKRENSVIMYEDDYSKKYDGFHPNRPESYIIFEFMANKYLEQSLNFASTIQRQLVRGAKRKNRNVRQAGFLVLRETSMPSVLVELGYISNRNEERYLISNKGQEALARSLYAAFKNYKSEFDKRSESPAFLTQENGGTTSSKMPISEKNEIEYRVQILISPRRYRSGASIFKGLTPVDFYRDGDIYKYTFGNTTDRRKIATLLKQAKQKFPDAFIVKFKDGSRSR